MDDLIDLSRDGGILRIALNRPAKINALTSGMMRDIAKAVRDADPRRDRLVVLSGNGAKGFCAGADLDELRRGGAAVEAQLDGLLELVEVFAACPIPSLCRVHGITFGGGAMIASLSTVVLAEADAQIGFPEIRFGMFPAIVYAALIDRIQPSIAFQLCVSGRRLSAAEAQSIGLVTEVLASGGGNDRVDFYAERAAAIAFGCRVARSGPVPSAAERVRRVIPLFMEALARTGSDSSPDSLRAGD